MYVYDGGETRETTRRLVSLIDSARGKFSGEQIAFGASSYETAY